MHFLIKVKSTAGEEEVSTKTSDNLVTEIPTTYFVLRKLPLSQEYSSRRSIVVNIILWHFRMKEKFIHGGVPTLEPADSEK